MIPEWNQRRLAWQTEVKTREHNVVDKYSRALCPCPTGLFFIGVAFPMEIWHDSRAFGNRFAEWSTTIAAHLDPSPDVGRLRETSRKFQCLHWNLRDAFATFSVVKHSGDTSPTGGEASANDRPSPGEATATFLCVAKQRRSIGDITAKYRWSIADVSMRGEPSVMRLRLSGMNPRRFGETSMTVYNYSCIFTYTITYIILLSIIVISKDDA